jgi:hypothetical protein
VLEPGSWGFNLYAPPSLDPDLVHVMGGPSVQARAVVDVTRDPPELVRYESFDW